MNDINFQTEQTFKFLAISGILLVLSSFFSSGLVFINVILINLIDSISSHSVLKFFLSLFVNSFQSSLFIVIFIKWLLITAAFGCIYLSLRLFPSYEEKFIVIPKLSKKNRYFTLDLMKNSFLFLTIISLILTILAITLPHVSSRTVETLDIIIHILLFIIAFVHLFVFINFTTFLEKSTSPVLKNVSFGKNEKRFLLSFAFIYFFDRLTLLILILIKEFSNLTNSTKRILDASQNITTEVLFTVILVIIGHIFIRIFHSNKEIILHQKAKEEPLPPLTNSDI